MEEKIDNLLYHHIKEAILRDYRIELLSTLNLLSLRPKNSQAAEIFKVTTRTILNDCKKFQLSQREKERNTEEMQGKIENSLGKQAKTEENEKKLCEYSDTQAINLAYMCDNPPKEPEEPAQPLTDKQEPAISNKKPRLPWLRGKHG